MRNIANNRLETRNGIHRMHTHKYSIFNNILKAQKALKILLKCYQPCRWAFFSKQNTTELTCILHLRRDDQLLPNTIIHASFECTMVHVLYLGDEVKKTLRNLTCILGTMTTLLCTVGGVDTPPDEFRSSRPRLGRPVSSSSPCPPSSPRRMLTSAYSMSEANTNTVQEDMKMSMA